MSARVDPEVAAGVEAVAAREDRTVSKVIERALRAYLWGPAAGEQKTAVILVESDKPDFVIGHDGTAGDQGDDTNERR